MSALFVAGLAVQPHGQSQQPTPFRSGTNVVRVDATVIDRNGRPVMSLTADDFEIREDDAVPTAGCFYDVPPSRRTGLQLSLEAGTHVRLR